MQRGTGRRTPGARDIERLLLTLAWTLSLLLGLLSLSIGPIVGRFLPSYASAVGATRIYMFTGVAQGLMAVAMLGSQAADRQRLIPPVTALAVLLSAAMAWMALRPGSRARRSARGVAGHASRLCGRAGRIGPSLHILAAGTSVRRRPGAAGGGGRIWSS